MDLDIKPDPDILEDTISQSAEFIDEYPSEQNAAIIPKKNNCNLQQKVFPTDIKTLLPNCTQPQIDHTSTATEFFSSNMNYNLQQTFFPVMVGPPLHYEPIQTQQQIIHPLTTVPKVVFSPNMNTKQRSVRNIIVPKLSAKSIQIQSHISKSVESVPTEACSGNSKNNLAGNVVPTVSGLPLTNKLNHTRPQIITSTTVFPTKSFFAHNNSSFQQEAVTPTNGPLLPCDSGRSRSKIYHSATLPNGVLFPKKEQSEDNLHKLKEQVTNNNARKRNELISSRLKKKYLNVLKEQSEDNLRKLKEQVINTNAKKRNELISSRLRKKFLNVFGVVGCSTSSITKLATTHNLNIEKILEFYDTASKEAQQYVHEECDSLSFNNITEWLKYLNTMGISKQCNFETAIILNTITNREQHPEPELMGGINLQAIYKFLSNALMGLPQEQLNETSAKFLSDEFQNLINEANTDEADNEVRNMKRLIEDTLVRTVNGRSHKLDPLNISTEELKKCYENLKKIIYQQ